MNIAEIDKTHTLVTDKAIVGVKCYSVDANGVYNIWDGDRWTGYFVADNGGNLREYDAWNGKMEIEKTDFEHNFNGSYMAGNRTYGLYTRHNVDIYNSIWIGGKEFPVMYQTGCSFEHNDYACPSSELEISREGGTDELIYSVWDYTETELDNMSDDDAQELVEELNGVCESIKTIDDVRSLYAAIVENTINAKQYFKDLELSDDLDDYDVEEETGELTKK